MASTDGTVVLEVRFRWWFRWLYVPAFKLFCLMSGCPWDEDQLDAMVLAYGRTMLKAMYLRTPGSR